MKKQLTATMLAFAFAFNLAPLTTVEAFTAETNNFYEFGNVKTRPNTYIDELRGVPVDGIVNLSTIKVSGQTIIGWYLDAAFTKPVQDETFLPSGFITITTSIMENGLYPKYASDVSATGGTVTGGGNTSGGNITTGASPTVVPSTGVAVLPQLF